MSSVASTPGSISPTCADLDARHLDDGAASGVQPGQASARSDQRAESDRGQHDLEQRDRRRRLGPAEHDAEVLRLPAEHHVGVARLARRQ